MKEKKQKKGSKLRSIILSVVLAVILWIIVGAIQDPDVSGTINNIPIEFNGVNNLTERGLIVSAASNTANIPLTVIGKRRDLINSSLGIGLAVDVSDITEPGTYNLEGNVVSSNNRLTVNRSRVSSVPVKIERLSSKDVTITLKQTNVPKGKLIKTKLSDTKVKVSGSESDISILEGVIAELDASHITDGSSVDLTLKPKLQGVQPPQSNTTITLSFSKVTATNTIYDKKTMPVRMKLNSKLTNDYWLDTKSSTCALSSVEIGVQPDCTAECVYLNINSPDSGEGPYMLLEEDGMYIPESVAEVYAKPVLEKKEQRHMDITVEAKNTPSGLTAAFNTTLTGSLVSAPENVLNDGNIKASIDLTGLTAGVHNIKVKPEDERVTFAEDMYIEVTLE